MRTNTCIRWIAVIILLGGPSGLGHAQPQPLNPSSLLVTILDENGSLSRKAHIYIFSKNKKQFMGTHEGRGVMTFTLPEGDYLVYAGLTIKSGDLVDHYASPEASIHVSGEEPASVILSLHKADDDNMTLSDSARKKLDIDPELAKYLN